MSYREITINGQQIKLIPLGDCACGCGQKTNIAKRNDPRRCWIKGIPLKYVLGHVARGRQYRWVNGTTKDKYGYIKIFDPAHQHADTKGYVYEHIAIAEKALGKRLPNGTHVHHHTLDQLVICQDLAYHKLLHQRQRAYEACGHASWRKCWICKQYDDPAHMSQDRNRFLHRACYNRHRKQRRRIKAAGHAFQTSPP